MITSKKISEEYGKLIKVFGKPVNIYINPDSSDIKELYKLAVSLGNKDVRFIADAKKQKVYVASAMLLQHDDIAKAFGYAPMNFDDFDNVPEYRIEGMARISGSKIIVDADEDQTPVLDTHGNYNWAFLEKYISGMNTYLNLLKRKYSKKN